MHSTVVKTLAVAAGTVAVWIWILLPVVEFLARWSA